MRADGMEERGELRQREGKGRKRMLKELGREGMEEEKKGVRGKEMG